MRAPSVKRLVDAFQIEPEAARRIRTLCHNCDNAPNLEDYIAAYCPETHAYARSCYGNPYRTAIWRVTMVLHAVNVIVKGYGVEGLGPPRSGDYAPPYEYVNMGDPYATTLVYCRKTDTLSIRCWGDIAERHPNWE
jgi:hypothetical protein